MLQSAAIKFEKAEKPIIAPVTKFGGQPVWSEKPQWPLSRVFGYPMHFVCQIALSDVPGLAGQLPSERGMAYLFMTFPEDEDMDHPGWRWQTFDPEAGENAVIIQPGGGSLVVSTIEQATGPGSEDEWVVRLVLREEPELRDKVSGLLGMVEGEKPELEDKLPADDSFLDFYGADKLGGVPYFIQHVEYPPTGGPWKLLLQIGDHIDECFSLNLGDAGVGYAFISEDGKQGRFLWQCA